MTPRYTHDQEFQRCSYIKKQKLILTGSKISSTIAQIAVSNIFSLPGMNLFIWR